MKSIAVDANPILSALLGGKSLEILCDKRIRFITTERIIWEVKKFIPEIAKKLGVEDTRLYYALENLPIMTLPPKEYDKQRELAEKLIAHRDRKDVDLLALCLATATPMWSQDKDFEDIEQITLFKTMDMIELAAQADSSSSILYLLQNKGEFFQVL